MTYYIILGGILLSFRVFLQSFKYRSGSFCHLFDIFPGLCTMSLPSFRVFCRLFAIFPCLFVVLYLSVSACRLISIVWVFCRLFVIFPYLFADISLSIWVFCHLFAIFSGLFAVFLSARSFCRLFPIFPSLFAALFFV